MADGADDGPPDPFFRGRVLVEVVTWEWSFHLRLSTTTPAEYTFQGGLDRVCGIEIEGRILAPVEHRGHKVRIDLMPFGPAMRFGRRGWDRVGWFSLPRTGPERRGYAARLLLPEADLPMMAMALGSTARYLHLWAVDLDVDEARITDYGISATIADKVKPWAGLA